jgi:glycerate kinase
MQIEAHDLIRIETFNEAQYISMDTIQEVETMVRLCQELNIHEENIDIIFNLLKKIEELQQELKETRSQLNAVRFEADE